MDEFFQLGLQLVQMLSAAGEFLMSSPMSWLGYYFPKDGVVFSLFPDWLQTFILDAMMMPLAFLLFGSAITFFITFKLIKFVLGLFK